MINWDAVGAIGEIVGALAVILTLFYLARQLRHNSEIVESHTKELRLSALQDTASSFSHLRDPIIRDPNVADIWQRATTDYHSLSGVEKVRADSMLQEFFFAHQAVFNRYLDGAYDQWTNHSNGIIKQFLRLPGIQQYWNRASPVMYQREFVDEINQLLANHEDSCNA
jgi:hypothetical protein